ncbi:hypothetical protein Tco_0155581 [Tanacetum coccineum]
MTESPLVDSGFVVPVFSLGDDPIACLNKSMAFLTAVASSRFPQPIINLELHQIQEPATIQDGRVILNLISPEFVRHWCQFMEYVNKVGLIERHCIKREWRRMNERPEQTDNGKGQQHTEQPESNKEGEFDQNADQCYDTRPLPAKLTNNMNLKNCLKISSSYFESDNVVSKDCS